MNQSVLSILEKEDRNIDEIDQLIQYFADIAFISTVLNSANQTVVQSLFSDITIRHYVKDEIVFFENDDSNGNMYVIVKGKIGIAIKKSINLFESQNEIASMRDLGKTRNLIYDDKMDVGDIKTILVKGNSFGEKAIIDKVGIRMATAIVVEDSSLLLIGRTKYLMIKDNMEDEQRIIRHIMLKVIPETHKISSPQIIEQLAYTLTYVNYKMGETVIQEGKSGDYLFILVDGECEVSKKIHFKMKQRKPTLLDQSIEKQTKILVPQTDRKRNKRQPINSIIKKQFTLIPAEKQEINLKKSIKQVDRGIYVKINTTQSMSLLGSEILFEKDHQSQLFTKFKQVQEHIDPNKELSSGKIQGIVKQWATDAYERSNSPYVYRVKVTSQKARCLKLNKNEFLMRFPKESVFKTQINYLMKIFQRFMVMDCHEEDIQQQLEEQDKKAWLIPGKEFICKKNESLYIKTLYNDYLLGNSLQGSIIQDVSKVGTLSRVPSLPQLKLFQNGDNIESINTGTRAYKQYRLPDTFDFGKQSLRMVEMNIQNELSNRGLLEKKKKVSHRALFQDIQKSLMDKVMYQKKIRCICISNNKRFNHHVILPPWSTNKKSYQLFMILFPTALTLQTLIDVIINIQQNCQRNLL